MDTPSIPTPPQPRPRRRWRRRLLIGLGVLLFLLLLPVGHYLYLEYCGEAELQAIVEKLDAEDPQWRMDEIQAKRAVIPDEDNSALQVQAALKGLLLTWTSRTVYQPLNDQAPPFRLDSQVALALQGDLKLLEAHVAEARKLAKLPRRRYPITWTPDFISTHFDHLQQPRQIAHLLCMDALARADSGDLLGAWESGQAILNAGRSVGDEPTAISALVHIAIKAVALGSLQRALAQGELPEAALAQTQKLLDAELAQNLPLTMARGERAWQHEVFLRIHTGALKPHTLLGGPPAVPAAPTLSGRLQDAFLRGSAKQAHAWSLRYMTGLVEVARRPPAERLEAMRELERLQRVQDAPALARLLLPALRKVTEATLREQGRADCARAALAAERFRLKQHRWPHSLAELIAAGLLREVPTDPFDGQPLRFRRTADGVVIYSVGLDKKYQGDGLDDIYNWDPNKVRVEFRLWNPDLRGQPPPPPRLQAEGGPEAEAPPPQK